MNLNIDPNQFMTMLKDFALDIKILKKKQSDLLKRIRKSIDMAKLSRIKKSNKYFRK